MLIYDNISDTLKVGLIKGLNPNAFYTAPTPLPIPPGDWDGPWADRYNSSGIVDSATVNSVTSTRITYFASYLTVYGYFCRGYPYGTTGVSQPGSIIYIKSGTGAGQYRIVTGFSGTTITVTPNWNTIPDTTSRFTLHPTRNEDQYDHTNEVYQYSLGIGFKFKNRYNWFYTFDAVTGAKAKLQVVLKREFFRQYSPSDSTDYNKISVTLPKWGVLYSDSTYSTAVINHTVDRQIAFDTDGTGDCSVDNGKIPLPYVIEVEVTEVIKKNSVVSPPGTFFIYLRTVDDLSGWVYGLTTIGNRVLAEVSTEIYTTGIYAPVLFMVKPDGTTFIERPMDVFTMAPVTQNIHGNIVRSEPNAIVVGDTLVPGELTGGYLRLTTPVGLWESYKIQGNTTSGININDTFSVLPTPDVNYEACFKRTPNVSA